MLNGPTQRHHAFSASLRRVELGDIPLLLYITAFVRQYFWLVTNDTIAWALTILITLPIWYFFLTTKPITPGKSKLYWPIVALPLFIITAADFFPAPIQFNPAPQIVNGITRHRTTTATSPLLAGGFNAQLTVSDSPTIVKAGARELVYVRIKNTSDTTWNALGQPDSKFAIKLGNHWFDEKGVMVVQELVAWFGSAGSKTLRLEVKVEP